MTLTFLFLTLLAIVTQALFALFEMAAVSFNKMRLQYYVSKGDKRAIWLNDLLHHPGRLFGTALICINAQAEIPNFPSTACSINY